MCSEVEQRFLLYLAANSSALDQAKGSIGFVGGAAGRCLGYKHSPILAKSKPLWESKIDFRLILWDNIENPGFHINKINVLPTPNRQNRLFIAGKCGTWGKFDCRFGKDSDEVLATCRWPRHRVRSKADRSGLVQHPFRLPQARLHQQEDRRKPHLPLLSAPCSIYRSRATMSGIFPALGHSPLMFRVNYSTSIRRTNRFFW